MFRVLWYAQKKKNNKHSHTNMKGEKTMNKNMLIKVLINGIVTLLVLGMLLSIAKGVSITEAIMTPYVIFIASTAMASSYIGFKRKARKENT